MVSLDILTSAKLALAMAMCDLSMSNVTLAEHLGVDEKIVRRLLDLDHVSRIDRLETLVRNENIRIERVVSKGHSSPKEGWYDQHRPALAP